MSNLNTLADIGKHYGMLTDDITGTNGFKTNGLSIAFFGNTLTTINGTFF